MAFPDVGRDHEILYYKNKAKKSLLSFKQTSNKHEDFRERENKTAL